MERQPSSCRCSPSFSTNSGFTRVMSCPLVAPTETSITITRRGTPICGAARPTPGAAYIVATMSSTRDRIPASISPTGRAGACSAGWPYFTMSRIAMPLGRVRGDRPLLGLARVPLQQGALAGAGGREVVEELGKGVAAEFLQHGVGQDERDHGFADDAGGGDDAGVAALDGRGL